MKLSFWDILASMVMLGGLALATIFINIFINPYSFINPFPPPTPVASLLVPTLTPSQRALPDVWTPTVGTPENTPLPGTSQANGTPTVTGTKFVLPSYTPSVVRTLGPMYTLTKAPIRTSTSSYKTSTKTSEPSDKTKPTNPGHPFTISSTSDPEPVWLWTGSKDSDSGMAYYQVTWGGDSNCGNKVYKLYVNMFTAPTITSGGTYYICVRAADQAGNQTSWIKGESSFTYNGASAPSSTTSGASSITSTSATLNGTINAHWYDTAVTFRYGPTTSYGTTVSASPATVYGSTTTSVTYALSGLTPHTTYHYRVYGTNALGSSNGADVSFTTLASPSMTTINSISVEPSTVGQPYIVTATVSGTGTPTGTVGVADGSSSCTITLAAGTGSCSLTSISAGTKTITATYNGDANNASSFGTASHTVNKGTPVVSIWPTASTITYGQTLASSTFSGGSAIPTGIFAWDSPTDIPIVGAPAQAVHFTPSDSANYNTVTGGTVSVTVNKATPTITFGATVPASPAYLGGDITVSATTTNSDSPALTYTYVSGPCTQATADTFTPTGPGACVVRADGIATANFNAATNTQSITIAKATAVITFDAAPTVTFGDPNFVVNATTTNSDDTTLIYSRVSGACTLASGATFNITSAGTCVVHAAGAATTNFNAASEDLSVTINKAAQTIAFDSSNPSPVTNGDTYVVAATASSGLAVTFGVSGDCTLGGSTVTFNLAGGSCTVTANQAGNANYDPAPAETQVIAINP